jgi:uncharacterized membrane protein
MRVLAIALMCVTMVCFTGQDTCAKWLSASLPIAQIVWARYVGAAVIALIASRSLSRPAMLRSKRPRLQLLRSVLLFCSTTANVFAVRELQLSETATISFLTPVFVALLAGPVLGEKVSAERMIAIALGFVGVVIATRPGTGAFLPIVLRYRGRCLQFAVRAGHPQACWRGLAPNDARVDASRRPRVSHSDIALGLEAAWISGGLGSHGGDGRFRGHQPRNADRGPSIRARADIDALHLHPAHLDDHFWRRGVWAVAGPRRARRGGAGCCLRRLSRR